MFSTALKQISVSVLSGLKQSTGLITVARMSASSNFETLAVTVPKPFVYHVELNRPKSLNAINGVMWKEIGLCMDELNEKSDCRVIVLSGAGRLFCAGIDLKDMMELAPKLAEHDDVARKAKAIAPMISLYQQSLTSLERCNKPVLAAIHSACIGGAVDLTTAADIRYCSKDAWFQVKEVDIGMAADVGTLQRLPKVISSDSLARELCYTARKMLALEALSCGLVSRVFEDKESLIAGTIEIAEQIASKSPVAVQGTKIALVYARDHTVQEGLDQMARWNQFMLQSEDFATATIAQATKQTDVVFSKL